MPCTQYAGQSRNLQCLTWKQLIHTQLLSQSHKPVHGVHAAGLGPVKLRSWTLNLMFYRDLIWTKVIPVSLQTWFYMGNTLNLGIWTVTGSYFWSGCGLVHLVCIFWQFCWLFTEDFPQVSSWRDQIDQPKEGLKPTEWDPLQCWHVFLPIGKWRMLQKEMLTQAGLFSARAWWIWPTAWRRSQLICPIFARQPSFCLNSYKISTQSAY